VPEVAASTPTTQSSRRNLRDAIAAHPGAAAVALYGSVTLAAAIAAYLAIFTGFAGYDDEGTLLVTLKAFVNGHALYRDIYTEYGPFYYELFGGFFSLTGLAVSTDASREIVIAVWVGTSLFLGLASQRLTGRLMLGVTGMIVAFAALAVLVNEPMHPQGLCVLLLAAFSLLAVAGPGRRVGLAGGACGALLAALAMTKVNLGAFSLAAVALAAVFALEPLRRRRWVRWPVILAFLAMPLFVLQRDLRESWVRDLLLLEVLAALAIVIAAHTPRPGPWEGRAVLTRWLLAAAAGFAVAFAAILGIVVLTGPTPADIYDGVISEALRVRDVLLLPFPLTPAAVDWALVSVGAAALAVRLRSGGEGEPTIWPGLLRGGAGLVIWFSIARIAPIGLNPSPGNPDTVPMVLAWVAAVPPAGAVESSYRRFLRVLLPALAVAETLQVYPVAGSQMGIGSIGFVLVGALCLGDAIACLRAWSAARGALALERLGAAVGIATLTLAGLFALDAIARPAASNLVVYRDQQALAIPGAEHLHLDPANVETYEGLVELAHKHRCTSLIGYPSLNSLYLWAGIEAPLPTAPGAWSKSLDAARQQRIVNEMRASPRPCAIRSESRAEGWQHGEPPAQLPLVRYIVNDFRFVAQAGDFEFLVAKPGAGA
jgi:hypothetical protein